MEAVDAQGQPVAGAEVQGTFSKDIDETLIASLDATGKAVFQTVTVIGGRSLLTFCGDAITVVGLPYAPADNVVTGAANH